MRKLIELYYQLGEVRLNLPRSLKAFFKGIIWAIWNIVSGLAPFLVIAFIAITLLSKGEQSAAVEEIRHLINDLVLLFFFSGMMGEVTIEAFLSKVKFGKYSYLGFCTSSFMILALVCILYTIVIFGKFKVLMFSSLNNLGTFQIIVITFALVYSIFIKSILFLEE